MLASLPCLIAVRFVAEGVYTKNDIGAAIELGRFSMSFLNGETRFLASPYVDVLDGLQKSSRSMALEEPIGYGWNVLV